MKEHDTHILPSKAVRPDRPIRGFYYYYYAPSCALGICRAPYLYSYGVLLGCRWYKKILSVIRGFIRWNDHADWTLRAHILFRNDITTLLLVMGHGYVCWTLPARLHMVMLCTFARYRIPFPTKSYHPRLQSHTKIDKRYLCCFISPR